MFSQAILIIKGLLVSLIKTTRNSSFHSSMNDKDVVDVDEERQLFILAQGRYVNTLQLTDKQFKLFPQ